MYRAVPASRRVVASARNPRLHIVRRRLATEAAPKKKKSVVRRVFWITAGATGTFYVGSTFVAFNHQPYYDFFSDNVPLGVPMLEYAETHGWNDLTVGDVVEAGQKAFIASQRFISDAIHGTDSSSKNVNDTKEISIGSVKKTAERKVKEAKDVVHKVVDEVKTKVEPATTAVKERINKATDKAGTLAQHEAQQVSDELLELVREAEAALQGEYKVSIGPPSPRELPLEITRPPTEEVPAATSEANSKSVYGAPLPLGFEPPPGYSRPAPPKKETSSSELKNITPIEIPLISPSISSLNASEPVINNLAGTIDNLASFLASNPAAATKASGILETAKADLTSLADRIEKVKEEERAALEAKLDEQNREYTVKMMELEMEAQDRLDHQQEDFRKVFDEERMKIAQAYRERLEHELRTQTELINERLKEEVIAQGIELQRRWIREVKVRVEQERGGRLGRLEELQSQLKRLERVTLDNSSYLDENIRVHALWSAVRALSSSALSSAVRKPFREELRVLRHVATAKDDAVTSSVLESLEASEVPDVGIEPFADLASWFTSSVAPKVCQVALVPEQNAGLLSYLASHLLSTIQFRRQGLVEGNDVLSVVARAEHYLNEKNLDSAARELNQLKGPAKVLLHDWLEAVRRRLEVEQALEVIQTQANLASLLVV